MEHSPPTSPLLRSLDPRTLLLAATGAAVCFSLIQSTAMACAGLLLALGLVMALRPPLGPLLKRLALANFFILFIWLTVPLTVPGESLAHFGPLDLSREGLALALSVTLKCNAILLCFLVLISDLKLPLIGYSLERLRVPAKLVFLFLFTCRYIHVIGEEWERLQTSARLRGFVPRTSLHTYRTIGNMLGLTVINSIDRSRRIYEAMLLRGFNGEFHTVAELKTARRDLCFGLSFGLALACLLAADIYMSLPFSG
ncbi:cobalt ECF transporter T component CbiQ [Desulfovibrio sp. OttesenSCG-928-C14]|nr:cobalt ECF transporter T component CbiQ [Desulfovibrio sp. OttesenSCG-928-C14]